MAIKPMSPPSAANPSAHYWHKRYNSAKVGSERIRAQLARAEKVIEAATAVLRWWDGPAPHQPKPNVPTGHVPMEALRLALAEYDRPSDPLDGKDK